MELFKKKEDCSGCAACASVCKNHAIKMEADKKGFLYPRIDINKCTDCGQCKKICHLDLNRKEPESIPFLAYAVRTIDEDVRKRSSSGGIFYELARYILKCGGVVYGAVFDENYQVVHERATNIKTVQKMQGSKYVQSNTNGIFELVKNDLSEGKMVLFTGCPCQIDGLKQYLKHFRQENLITCDLICLGVNSPKVWKEYLSYMTGRQKIAEIRFRSKIHGWRNTVMYIRTDKRTYIEQSEYDYFYQAFNGYLSLRDSCFKCKYTNLERRGDVTIGDFWGIEKICQKMDDGQGVSLVLLNSMKGIEIFHEIENMLITKKVQPEQVMQPSLKRPAERPEKYELFWNDYINYGFSFVCKKYLNGSVIGKAKKLVKKGLIKINIWDYLR